MPGPVDTVFLDRDGTINRKADEGEYIERWQDFEFLPGALAGIASMSARGMRLVVVTNQRGVARGRMTAAAVRHMHARMVRAIAVAGGRIEGVFVCPHETGCICRKPMTGLFEQARAELAVDFASAAVIGDAASDMQAAYRIGAVGIRIAADPLALPSALDGEARDHVAHDLADAAEFLMSSIA